MYDILGLGMAQGLCARSDVIRLVRTCQLSGSKLLGIFSLWADTKPREFAEPAVPAVLPSKRLEIQGSNRLKAGTQEGRQYPGIQVAFTNVA